MAQLLKTQSIQYLSVLAFSVFKIPALSDSHLGEGGKKENHYVICYVVDGKGLKAADPYLLLWCYCPLTFI